MQAVRRSGAALLGLALVGAISLGCNDGGATPPHLNGGSGGSAGMGGSGGAPVTVTPVAIQAATATRTPRTGTWSVNYWTWTPSFGNDLPGTESLVAALTPTYLRVGGYNNDANTPSTFDNAQLDAMVTYARAIGAEPILQVPHLAADSSGTPATAANAAAMVTYANVTKGYGIKYFSIGNEPDLYDSAGLPADSTQPAIPGYTTDQYCASVTTYVTAMKAVDPTIKIVGPDLAYKYQAGNGSNDWLTPILTTCGSLFDVISIHRYPFEAKMATLPAAAERRADRFPPGDDLGARILQATGQGAKPLALTEMNVAYDNTGCVLEASPGTVGSALWMADVLGAGIELNLWTSAVWDISDDDDWSLGLIGLPPEPRAPAGVLRVRALRESLWPDAAAGADGIAGRRLRLRQPRSGRRRDRGHRRQLERGAGGLEAPGHGARHRARCADLSGAGRGDGRDRDQGQRRRDRLDLWRCRTARGGRSSG